MAVLLPRRTSQAVENRILGLTQFYPRTLPLLQNQLHTHRDQLSVTGAPGRRYISTKLSAYRKIFSHPSGTKLPSVVSYEAHHTQYDCEPDNFHPKVVKENIKQKSGVPQISTRKIGPNRNPIR
jgi:hypothetical protein